MPKLIEASVCNHEKRPRHVQHGEAFVVTGSVFTGNEPSRSAYRPFLLSLPGPIGPICPLEPELIGLCCDIGADARGAEGACLGPAAGLALEPPRLEPG